MNSGQLDARMPLSLFERTVNALVMGCLCFSKDIFTWLWTRLLGNHDLFDDYLVSLTISFLQFQDATVARVSLGLEG